MISIRETNQRIFKCPSEACREFASCAYAFYTILGDPGADSGGDIVPRGSSNLSLLFFVPHFSARLDFPSPPLSAPGSPRMLLYKYT